MMGLHMEAGNGYVPKYYTGSDQNSAPMGGNQGQFSSQQNPLQQNNQGMLQMPNENNYHGGPGHAMYMPEGNGAPLGSTGLTAEILNNG